MRARICSEGDFRCSEDRFSSTLGATNAQGRQGFWIRLAFRICNLQDEREFERLYFHEDARPRSWNEEAREGKKSTQQFHLTTPSGKQVCVCNTRFPFPRL